MKKEDKIFGIVAIGVSVVGWLLLYALIGSNIII